MSNQSMLSDLTGRSGESTAVNGGIAKRLRTGQERLTNTWVQLQDVEDWTESQEFKFWLDYEKWDRMERQARESGQIEGCPIGEAGCHKDAPICCGHCAAENMVRVADAPADGAGDQSVGSVVCKRIGNLKVIFAQDSSGNGQATMFDLTSKVH